ncbi:MAG TPA: HAMP domain-containing sensor histidine kinase [Candidatus Saccharimonadales bacterium]|nr:HAMP domain-containing sensor histidine kinase [Candidatus Saccharimonadales bacterium]
MFHSAALRLTVWYLAIIMAVSLIFSAILYNVSSADLERNVNRQLGYFNNFLGPDDFNNYNLLRRKQLNDDKDHLRGSLILFNLAVLGGGGAASYWLARRTLQPIEDALTAQTRFAADASHELRTPLTAIQTENEVALRNPALKKTEAVALLKSNLEEIAKLKALSDGLLKLANNSGRIESAKPVPLKSALQIAIDRLAKAAELKKIKVDNQAGVINVIGDRDSLSELFYTLLENAIKYSPAGSPVKITSASRHHEAIVTVADKGPGIKADELPSIFERFYQSDSSRTKRDNGGYGLGLAIAKKITDAHGGHIEVKSTLGKGSSFIVHLPSA